MFKDSKAFSSFSVSDMAVAKEFYGQTLGLEVEDFSTAMPMLIIHLATGGTVLLYSRDDHTPATYTVLNFPVDNTESVVDELATRGITCEQYQGEMATDEKGIFRGNDSPPMAWFKDPFGNILSVVEMKG